MGVECPEMVLHNKEFSFTFIHSDIFWSLYLGKGSFQSYVTTIIYC